MINEGYWQEGFITVSHVLRGGRNKRYDYIMITPHFNLVSMDYRYEDALNHGSDHAVLVADLEWGGVESISSPIN